MINPMPGYIVLGAPVMESETAAGIILSEAQQKNQATVIAVGKGVQSVKTGDQVIFRPYAGDKVKYDDKEYLIVHEKELKAIVSTN